MTQPTLPVGLNFIPPTILPTMSRNSYLLIPGSLHAERENSSNSIFEVKAIEKMKSQKADDHFFDTKRGATENEKKIHK